TVLLRRVLEPAFTVGTRVADANERVQQAVQAGTQGIRDVKLFGMTGELFDKFRKALDNYTRSSIRLARNEAALMNFYDLATALTLFALIYIGFVFSALKLGELGIFFFAMYRVAPLASRFNSQVYRLEGDLGHLVRTHRFLDEIDERLETGGDRDLDAIESVTFDGVHFAYDGDERVIQDLSFGFEAGEFVGFAGQSGAGKSTIVSLLTRMYTPDAGEIRANGVPIEAYDLDAWRSRIAVVRQQPFIFNATLRENVTIADRDASDADVERVCEIARVDEFLDDLPWGLDTPLGDDGVRLSGGQRQRVALARALLKDADVLVLDEATSDLDSHLEQQVQSAIEAMEREYAILAIAHRLSTVQNADRIYTMAAGEIVESGSHEELMDRGGPYAELYAVQSAN
ncbi:MAG: ABC transporter ATP-binding protein, partial [archaeon]